LEKLYNSIRFDAQKEYYVPRLKFLLRKCEDLQKVVQRESFPYLDDKIKIVRHKIEKRINSVKKHIQKANEKYTFPRSKPGRAKQYKDAQLDARRLPITTSKSLYTYRGGHPRQ
jgi:hypothetical protein